MWKSNAKGKDETALAPVKTSPSSLPNAFGVLGMTIPTDKFVLDCEEGTHPVVYLEISFYLSRTKSTLFAVRGR